MSYFKYTTQVDPLKSIGEIQGLLISKGVRSIRTDYTDSGEPQAISFLIEKDNQQIPFRLPNNHEGVLLAMERDRKIPYRFKNSDQAKRVSWRIVKEWVQVQMALVEAGQAEIDEVFMPYAVMRSGETLYQYFTANSQRLLNAASVQEEEKVVNFKKS